nr:polysaccharide biosynthesis C-terminal domain-containing protein [uncultured Sphaerochaeta sp.]
MTRRYKLMLNTLTSLVNQLIVVVCGIILPRLFIKAYGSDVNGLIASITQFVSIIAFLELGVGAVVQASLYSPLAKRNTNEISRILVSSNRFFKKIGLLLVLYSVALFLFYPLIVDSPYSFLYTGSLILIIAFSSFSQYFFGISYQLLLNADQLGFVTFITNSLTTIINTVIVVILIRFNQSVQMVKLISALIFLSRPLVYQFIVRRRYHPDLSIQLVSEPIKQKWNGIAQHLASVILNSTDMIVLTLFSTLNTVSVYSVHFMVVNSIKKIVLSLTSGVGALFGSMLSNGEIKKLNQVYDKFEWMIHTFVVLVFTITGILITPFIAVYTADITDATYIYPLFAVLLTMAQALYCLRLPYNQLVLAAGHFKETQRSAIIEASLNIIISIVLVRRFGLIGVAIGTFIAMAYRTFYLVWYLSRNIIRRSLKHFLLHCLVDALSLGLMVVITQGVFLIDHTYFDWIVMALKVSVLCFGVTLLINLVFYPKMVLSIKQGIRR